MPARTPLPPGPAPTVSTEPSITEKAWGAVSYIGSGTASLAQSFYRNVMAPTGQAIGSGTSAVAKPALAWASGHTKVLPRSPSDMNKILRKYNRSYDLTAFNDLAKEAANNLAGIQPLTTKGYTDPSHPGVTTVVDLLEFGEVGKEIKQAVDDDVDNHDILGLENKLQSLQAYLADDELNPKDLTGEANLQGDYAALISSMSDDEGDVHTPTQAITVIKNLHKQAIDRIQASKQKTAARLQGLVPTDMTSLSDAQRNFIHLCKIDPTGRNAIRKTQEKVNQLIEHSNKQFQQAEDELNKKFEGVPAKKDGDKDVPEVPGIKKKLNNAREKSEADLIERGLHLQRMEDKGYKIPTGVSLSGSDIPDDAEKRARCLKGKSMQDLLGLTWGKNDKKSLQTVHTRRGTPLEIEYDNSGKAKSISLKIDPMWLEMFEDSWKEKMELNLEDFISQIKAKDGLDEGLSLKIDHPEDSNRNAMVLATYRAALKNGYKPEDIKFTVTGSKDDKDNKKTFTNKPAKEVLAALGLPTEHPDITKHLNEEKMRVHSEEKAAQRKVGDAIRELRESSDRDITSKDIHEDNSSSIAGPGASVRR